MQNRPPLAWWISSQARQRETEASLTFLAPGTLCLPGRPLCRAQAFQHTQGCLSLAVAAGEGEGQLPCTHKGWGWSGEGRAGDLIFAAWV